MCSEITSVGPFFICHSESHRITGRDKRLAATSSPAP